MYDKTFEIVFKKRQKCMVNIMKILVTGAKGFVGKNLVLKLKNQGYADVFEFDVDTDPLLLNEFCAKTNFVCADGHIFQTEKHDLPVTQMNAILDSDLTRAREEM